MTGNGMAAVIMANIEALEASDGEGDISFVRSDILEAVCAGIVSYIQSNAVVPSTGTVTTGSGAGGAVTTTGAVT